MLCRPSQKLNVAGSRLFKQWGKIVCSIAVIAEREEALRGLRIALRCYGVAGASSTFGSSDFAGSGALIIKATPSVPG
jgi:hypothetical protein